jgi:hypothetical protein
MRSFPSRDLSRNSHILNCQTSDVFAEAGDPEGRFNRIRRPSRRGYLRFRDVLPQGQARCPASLFETCIVVEGQFFCEKVASIDADCAAATATKGSH